MIFPKIPKPLPGTSQYAECVFPPAYATSLRGLCKSALGSSSEPQSNTKTSTNFVAPGSENAQLPKSWTGMIPISGANQPARPMNQHMLHIAGTIFRLYGKEVNHCEVTRCGPAEAFQPYQDSTEGDIFVLTWSTREQCRFQLDVASAHLSIRSNPQPPSLSTQRMPPVNCRTHALLLL